MLKDQKTIITAEKLADELGTDDVKSVIRSAKKHDCLYKDGPFCFINRERYLASVEAEALKKLTGDDESESRE